jgi:DNA-binding NtrC family response regulator
MTSLTASILLVDDDSEFVDPITFWLKNKGYNATQTYNGKDAIEAIKKSMPAMIFLDINMPGMDGLETLAEIRKISQSLPVIMITAYGTRTRLKEAKKHGISGFFPKDSELTDIIKLIETVLRKHATQN